MQLAEASHYLPFDVPILPLWDGSTYGPWVQYDGYVYGLYYEARFPSASSTEYIAVCGPGTKFNVNFTLDELIEIYWRARSFNANISFSGISWNGVAERKGSIQNDYYSDGSSDQYEQNGLAITETYPLVRCYETNDTMFHFYKYGAMPPYTTYEIRFYIPAFGANVVADPDGNYWVNLPILIMSTTPSPMHFANAIGCIPNGEYSIGTSTFEVQGDTCSGYRTAATTPSAFQFTAFGKTVPLHDFEWSWMDPSSPNAGDFPILYSGSISIDIDDYFDYSDYPIAFLKDF